MSVAESLHVRPARPSELRSLYRESYEVWGAGLSRRDYQAFWRGLAETPWAREHFRTWVLADAAGHVFSSLKLYRTPVRWWGERTTVAGIGAVFTPKRHRRFGHASRLIREVLDHARREGHRAALLFSDIGTRLYERLGFVALPAEECWGRLPDAAPDDAPRLEPMRDEHLPDVRRIYDAAARTRPFAVVRDAAYWDYLVERSRGFFRRLDGSDLSQRFQVALRDGRVEGYVISVDTGEVWILREAETEEPGRWPHLMRAAAAQARALGRRRAYAWLDRDRAARLPEWRWIYQPRGRAVPMLCPLNGPLPGGDAFFRTPFGLSYMDQF